VRKFIGVLFIIIGIPIFIAGLIALISPMAFVWLVSHSPENVQLWLFGDMLLGVTPRSWAYLAGGGLSTFLGFWLTGR
jgi:hypothetical protein